MERRLAAILAADAVGYSRLMGFDEEAARVTGGEMNPCAGPKAKPSLFSLSRKEPRR
jgi:hypothetical protein